MTGFVVVPPVLIRLPQPEQKMSVLERIAMAIAVPRVRRRKAKPVSGNRRNARRAVEPELPWKAVVCGVLMVRVNVLGVVPGGR